MSEPVSPGERAAAGPDPSVVEAMRVAVDAGHRAVQHALSALEAQARVAVLSMVMLVVVGVASALLLLGAYGLLVAAAVAALVTLGWSLWLALVVIAVVQLGVTAALLYRCRTLASRVRVPTLPSTSSDIAVAS